MTRRLPALLVLALILSGCDRNTQDERIDVSVIGPPARLRDPAIGIERLPDIALTGAVSQGLVSLDAAGQVVPGIAQRWAISDDGLYYTFRIADEIIDADRVAAQLRRQFRRLDETDPSAISDAVREVVAVTPEVIEIRLSAPRPDLLALLAGPDFALTKKSGGTGPLLMVGKPGRMVILRPAEATAGPERDGEEADAPDPRRIHLRGERAALAVARYADGGATLVTGGTFVDIMLPAIAKISPRDLQLDPANGLFGFRVGRASPPMMAAEIRQALSMSLDRDAIGTALGIAGWRPSLDILPPGLTDVVQPSRPFWAQAFADVRGADQRALAARVASARQIVANWQKRAGATGPLRLSVDLPEGPGARIVFAELARQWRAIGVEMVRTGPGQPADLRLIDEVAPVDQADWYLAHFRCARGRPCSEEADTALDEARRATDPAARARFVAEAEQRLTALGPFIPLAQPVRWSLAAQGLNGFQTNSRAVHPLAPLMGNQRRR